MTTGVKTTKKSVKKPAKKASLKVKVLKNTKQKKAPKKTVTTKKKQLKPRTRISKTSKKALVHKSTVRVKKNQQSAVEQVDKITPRILYERVEREKLFIIRVGVTFIMAVIVLVWIFTLKGSIKVADNDDLDRGALESLQQITNSVSEKIDQINIDLDKVQSFSSTSNSILGEVVDQEVQSQRLQFKKASSSIPLLIDKLNHLEVATGTLASLSTSTVEIDQNDIEVLKKRIKELEDKLSE